MSRVIIRQSGGANIISLPKAILKVLDLHTDSELDLVLEDNKIVLTPIKNKELTLKDLLAGSPKKKLKLKEEDLEWLNAKSKGKEKI